MLCGNSMYCFGNFSVNLKLKKFKVFFVCFLTTHAKKVAV